MVVVVIHSSYRGKFFTRGFAPRLGSGKTIALRALYGMDAQVTTRDQHGLADSSINYTAVAYQTRGARMCYKHSALRASHSYECTECNMTG